MTEASNRMQRPGLAVGFSAWTDYHQAGKRARVIARLVRNEAGLQGEASALETELHSMRAEYEAKLRAAKDDKDMALERQLVELTGSAEERMALQAERDKEARVELLRRQIVRRVMNAGLANGWAAWHELWSAKMYAMERLREVGNHMNAPYLSAAFVFWMRQWYARPTRRCYPICTGPWPRRPLPRCCSSHPQLSALGFSRVPAQGKGQARGGARGD